MFTPPRFPLPLSAPELIYAEYSFANGRATLTFSEDLAPGPYTPANFQLWDSLNERIVTSANRIGVGLVRLSTAVGPPAAGPSRLNYFATPPELVSAVTGLPVPAYSEFPVTVVF